MADEVRRFFIIGAQRSGTTLLHRALRGHPEVAMNEPVRPEPKHFLTRGSEHSDPNDYDRRYFRDRGSPVRGEKSTTYLERPDAAARITACFPDAQFIAIVRDPVDRALSNYRLSVEHGFEDLPPETALTEDAEQRPWDRSRLSASPFHYLRRGRYAEQLAAWSDHVQRESMLVVTFEEVVAGDLHGVLDHLELQAHPNVVADGPVNASPPLSEMQIDPSLRDALRSYFAMPNRRLSSEWGVDISAWMEPA